MRYRKPLLIQTAFLLVFLIGIVLSMKSIREPDLWWQLRTGEWMLQHKQVPVSDVFSFSYEGTQWINVKWGYEVLQALVSKTGGPEMLPLLQVFITTLLLLVLLKSTSTLGKTIENQNYRPGFGVVLALLATLWVIENRMTGRPEAVSHLMTASFALIFLEHRRKPSFWIFLIIPLQILWTNLHEAYGLGIILATMFTVSAWGEYFFLRKKKWYTSPSKQSIPWQISLATILAFLAIALNPRGTILWWHPIEIFSQLGENKYTIELYSFMMIEFWNYRSIFTLVAAYLSFRFLVSDSFMKDSGKLKQSWWQKGLNKVGLGYAFFLLACLYLTLSANRNIPFAMIAMLPILGIAWDRWIIRLEVKFPRLKPGRIIIVVCILFYLGIVSGKYYQFFNPRDRFGLEINVEKTPHGAASFIKENKIQGRAFTDFLCSSYLLWYLQPSFKTYIDLRDLDIFPPVFFKNNFALYQFPEQVFPYADADMQFDYIVLLNNPQFQPVHRYLLSADGFDLVYGDLLASVYLRKNEVNKDLINRMGFRSSGQDVFHAFQAIPVSKQARIITKVFNPFHTFQVYKSIDPQARTAYYQYLGYSPQSL